MSELTYQWFVITLDASIKVTLLALTALAVIFLLRIRDSSVRHRLWVGVLLGMLLLPIVSPFMPSTGFPASFNAVVSENEAIDGVTPQSRGSTGSFATQPTRNHGDVGNAAFATTPTDFSATLPLSEHSFPRSGATPNASDLVVTSLQSESVVVTTSIAHRLRAAILRVRDSAPLLLMAWLVGLFALMLRLVFGMWMATRLVHGSSLISAQELDAIGLESDDLIATSVLVYECPRLRVPVTVGIFRTRILLPPAWVTWSDEKVQSVLAHETAHVRRHDTMTMVLSEINRAVYWFHPLAWWVRRHLADLAESACDDEAIGISGDRTSYARHLLEVAAQVSAGQGRLVPIGVSMARHSNVETRIDSILDFTRPLSKRLSRTTTIGIMSVAIALIGLFAAMKPNAQAGDQPVEQSSGITEADTNASEAGNATSVKQEDSDRATEQSRQVTGRVLDESGQPIANAKLLAADVLKGPIVSMDDIQFLEIGTTNDEGRFDVRMPKHPDIPSRMNDEIFVYKTGYGVNWINLTEGDSATKETVLLQEALVTGQILNTEGQPIADARISVQLLAHPKTDRTIDDLIAAWKNDWNSAFTNTMDFAYTRPTMLTTHSDDHGRFTVRGIPPGWAAIVDVFSEEHAFSTFYVFNKNGIDVQGLNKAARSSSMQLNVPAVTGPQITHICEPGLVVSGRVVDDEGKPLGKISVRASIGYDSARATQSDENGHYRLDGLHRGRETLVSFRQTGKDRDLLARTTAVKSDATAGKATLDMMLKRGIVVTGTVTESDGTPVTNCSVRFVPLANNEFSQQPGYDGYKRSRVSQSSRDGKFRLVVIPGPGVLVVQASNGDRTGKDRVTYQQVNLTDEQKEKLGVTGTGRDQRFISAGNSLELLRVHNAIACVDFAEGSGPHEIGVSVSRGNSIVVNVTDASGIPVRGVFVSGVTENWPLTAHLKEPNCTVQGLSSERPRKVLFLHAGRDFAGSVTLTGDETSPVTVKMGPSATIRGRAIDPSGEPIAGADIHINFFREYASELYRFLGEELVKTTTDAEGRFVISDVVPGERFNLDGSLNGDNIRAQAKPELIKKLGFDPEKGVRRLSAPEGGEHDFGDLLFGPPFGETLPWPK